MGKERKKERPITNVFINVILLGDLAGWGGKMNRERESIAG